MLISALAKPLAVTGAAVLWVGVPTMLPSSNGAWSFTPTNFSSSGASCSTCHTGSAPSAQSSRTSLTADAGITALSAGQSIQLTTALDATGANTTFGGFVCEASGGSFTAGANTQTTTNGLSTISVSHVDKNSRSWTYTFNAPTSPGLVELTSAGLAVNNDGQAFVAGDHVSFSGFDKTATSATPLRLYVLPTGVTNIGTSCTDGYGNTPVLGANNVPMPGDASFEIRLHGASPGQTAFLWGAVGAGGFSQSLTPLGLDGCTSYIQNVDANQVAVTSAGVAERADGSVAFMLPIANDPSLIGTQYHLQAGYVDPSAGTAFPAGSPVSTGARSLDLTLTHGLEITIQ